MRAARRIMNGDAASRRQDRRGGKPWREADADVAEAIDFCEFYAAGDAPSARPAARDVPGETNRIEQSPAASAAVIAPWNFPLAILCRDDRRRPGRRQHRRLSSRPSSRPSSRKLVRILQEAGLPPGVIHYLPGRGEEVGQVLVDHPERRPHRLHRLARRSACEINRQAADTQPGQEHVKRVIAEMGGKNAIIVDDDADLDEAVAASSESAFGYAGQKCSACSRAIVLEAIYEAFVARLVEAAKSPERRPGRATRTRLVGP